jgi:hypothetical protein
MAEHMIDAIWVKDTDRPTIHFTAAALEALRAAGLRVVQVPVGEGA